MICFPNAKINIGLRVLGKRKDNYHDIESIIYPLKETAGGMVEWWNVGMMKCSPIFYSSNFPFFHYDALEIIKSQKLSSSNNKFALAKIRSSGLQIKGEEKNNLCVKAYELLKNDFSLSSISIHLHKAIPMGTGLGGGSADGAFMIKLLNEEFKLNLSEKKMMDYAGKLGSDCPFFIRNEPAFVHGRGEHIEEIEEIEEIKRKNIVVVYSGISVNTAEAYKEFDNAKCKMQNVKYKIQKSEVKLNELIRLPIEEWKNNVYNDFEKVIFEKHLLLKTIKEKLYSLGALYASMSGSGSAVYGIFR